jgi:mevalonate kinase
MKAVAEAPSKAIITGEHFVVHGAWGLAVALPPKIRVEMRPSSIFAVSSDRFAKGSAELNPVGLVVESMARTFGVEPNVDISISSSIPEGAGLGSSAATTVAVAAAYSRLNLLSLGIQEILTSAMVGEKEIHGNPSGIDPATCAYGGTVMFRPGREPRRLQLDGERSLIVSYSGRKRSTKSLISEVASKKERNQELFAALGSSVGWLSESACEMLLDGNMRSLGSLLTLNHAVLKTIGISNEALDSMVEALCSMGCYGAKLTGAGGGGSVISVCPKAKEKSIVSGLSERGFETFAVKIPVEGVKSWLEQ